MFEDEELEQIREEQDEWQGHVDRQTVRRSRTSKKVLFGSMMASFVMVAFVTFLVASGMVTTALVGASGIGGFNADIQKLTGNDIAIYPAVGPTAACDSEKKFNEAGPQGTNTNTLPQLRGEIGGATVPEGQTLTITKDVQTPDIADIGMFRLNVTASNENQDLNLQNAILYLTALNASKLEVQNAQIREFFTDGTSTNPRFYSGGNGSQVTDGPADPGEFAIRNRPGTNASAVIAGAKARAHYIAFDKLEIQDVALELEYFAPGNLPADNVTADDGCPVP